LFPHSVVPSINQSINQSIYLSINQSTNQSINQSINQSSSSKNPQIRKKYFKFEFLTYFLRGPSQNACVIFQKKSLFPPPAVQIFPLSPGRQKFEILFVKIENSRIFELPDPKIGGGVGHFGSG
jgi:hypothetical protein